jgi:hypothetical protein
MIDKHDYTEEERREKRRWNSYEQHAAETRRLQEQNDTPPQRSRPSLPPPPPPPIDTRRAEHRRSFDASPRDRDRDTRMGFSRKTSNNWPQVDGDHRDAERFRPRHGSDNGRRDSEDRSFTEHGSIGGQTPRSIRQFSPGPKSAVPTGEERSVGPPNELARLI